MAEHAEVFISATTRDLGSYRREIKDALLTLQIFPIEESTFTLAYGPLTEMLRELVGRCDAVIHLAGFCYGAEPPQRPPDQPRRSYTQREYDVARELGKPVYLFLATKDCAFDELLEEGEGQRALQLAHRHAIEQCKDVYYPFTTREDLCSRVRELRLPARRAEAPRRVTNLPYASLGPLFKGRDAALAQLRQRLASGPCQAIHGLGGVGKTRLAIEHAWRQAVDYTALLFASARSAADLRTNLAGFCDPLVLNLPEQGRPEEAQRLAAVLRWLGERPGWLLILDNADSPDAAAEVEEMLPRLQGGQILITSRLADWSPAVQTADPLDVLEEAEAAAFLLARTESKRRETPADPQEAAAVARDLGGLALALEQAGAYVAKNVLSFSQYRQRWEARKAEVLAWHDPRLMHYPSSVAVTWQTTVEQLGAAERALLNALAWLAPEPVPILVLENWSFEGAEATDTLAELASWSLARWTADQDAFTVHRLVQEITRRSLTEEGVMASLESALAQIGASLPDPEWNEVGWQLWERLAPHCRTLLDHLREHVMEPKATYMMNQLAVWFSNRAEYTEAQPLYQRALAIREKVLGPEHPDVATSLNNLAVLCRAQGRYAEAQPLYQRALAIREKVFGPEHPDVAASLNDLAGLYRAQGRYAEARPLYQRALAIREKVLGPEHPNVATSLNNLAVLYYNQGQYAEAQPLYQRALAIREKVLGPEHPNVATSLNDLAGLYRGQGRYAEAQPLYQRALAIWEKVLGPEHPNVAASLNDLAGLYRAQGRYAEAEPLYQRALAIREKVLGSEHPDVATSLNSLAGLYRAQGRYAEAQPLYQRALAIREKVFGPEHPDMANSLNDLAGLYRAQGRYAEAQPLYERALAIWEKVLGPEHPNVATSLNNLAGLHYDQGRYAEAEPLYQRALAIREKVLGPEHPNVAQSLNNLAALYNAQGRYAEAEPLYQRALAIREKVLGPEHPNVATSLNSLAGLYHDQGRYAETQSLYQRALAIREKVLGPEHPNVATSLINLAGLYYDQGRYAETQSLYRRALAIRERALGPEHPDVATSLENYAFLLRNMGRLVEAELLESRAKVIHEKHA